MNGNGTSRCEVYSTECVYLLADFGVSPIESVHEERATSKEMPNGNECAYPITDTDFINDLFTLPSSDLITKYRERYYYLPQFGITESLIR